MNNFFEIIKCPLCNYNDCKIIIKSKYKKKISYEYLRKIFLSSGTKFMDQVVKCNKCSLIYTNPRIKEKIINRGYSSSIDKKFISQDQMRIKSFENTIDILNKKINLSKKKFLDVGSAGGAFLKACLNKNITADGIEPNKWLVNFGKKNYQVNIKNVKLNEVKKKYDVVSFFDVIEHVPNLKKLVLNINKVTKKNGYLIVTVPDHDSYARKILGGNWPFYLNVHVHYFTKDTLMKLFGAKYSLIYNKSYWPTLQLSYVLNRATKIFKVFKIFEILINIFGLGKMSIKYNMGQTLFIFKKK